MYHIILVEDDEQIRKSLTELLTYKGYTVTAVVLRKQHTMHIF